MSEAQRIGQVFMIGLRKDRLDAAERSAIASFHFGSVAFTTQSSGGVEMIRALTDRVQALATKAATAGVGFLVAANQEGGQIQGLSGPGFDVIPSALKQGTWTPAKLKRMAARWGRELRDAGVNLDFAPVGDVVPPGTDAQNAPIGQLHRAFGHDPETVASHVGSFIAGSRVKDEEGPPRRHRPRGVGSGRRRGSWQAAQGMRGRIAGLSAATALSTG
jgi:beta-N-acetylhexosaminidase